MYDFHARQYDPQLGRWHVPDPLNQYVSPYVAMGNNPVSIVDPTGEGGHDWITLGPINVPFYSGKDALRVMSYASISHMQGFGCSQLDISMSYNLMDGTGKGLQT